MIIPSRSFCSSLIKSRTRTILFPNFSSTALVLESISKPVSVSSLTSSDPLDMKEAGYKSETSGSCDTLARNAVESSKAETSWSWAWLFDSWVGLLWRDGLECEWEPSWLCFSISRLWLFEISVTYLGALHWTVTKSFDVVRVKGLVPFVWVARSSFHAGQPGGRPTTTGCFTANRLLGGNHVETVHGS